MHKESWCIIWSNFKMYWRKARSAIGKYCNSTWLFKSVLRNWQVHVQSCQNATRAMYNIFAQSLQKRRQNDVALRVLTFAEVARRSSMKMLSNYFAKLTGKNPRCRFYNKAMGPLKKTPSQVNFELWTLRNNQNNYNKEHQSKAPSTLTKFDTLLCISYCFWHALVAWDTNNHLLRNNNRQWLFKMFYNLNLKLWWWSTRFLLSNANLNRSWPLRLWLLTQDNSFSANKMASFTF